MAGLAGLTNLYKGNYSTPTGAVGNTEVDAAGISTMFNNPTTVSGTTPGFDFGGFLGGVDALAKLGNVGVGLANYGLAKDAYNFNKMNANRNYEADKLKYNNALARTEAVNAVYGSPNVATKL